MAEAVVDFVFDKLQDAITGAIHDALLQEGKSLYGVNDKAEAVLRELRRIKSFLKDADSRCEFDERMKNWVSSTRAVAYDIEDTIDKFQAAVDESIHVEPGMFSWVKKTYKKMMLVPALHVLSTELDGIQKRIEEISTGKDSYGIQSLEGSSKKIYKKTIVVAEIKETGIVGIESDKDNIIRQLLDEKNPRRAVVSIVGPGGIGKTTLAHAVFNSTQVEKHFKVLIWLSVSHDFTLMDLLKKMNAKTHPVNPREHDQHEEELLMELHNSMKNKKYLVILDDIWGDDVWRQLEVALPDVKNGSRVLVTSRNYNVPKTIDPISKPYELKCLKEEESLKLLLKKALPEIESDKDYPEDLAKLAKEFVKKCDGFPLQLVVLGGLLSKKNRYKSDWDRVLHNLDWFSGSDGQKCFDAISSSYEDLPSYLKSCFMSFSAFPEEYEIEAQSLISYWIVEGFVGKEGSATPTEKALSYLDELIDRCMVQVVRRSSTGYIEIIRVHELLRNLAIHEAKAKSFITIFKKLDDYGDSSTSIARHASFHFYTPEMKGGDSFEEKDVIEYTGPNVRSLMLFGNFLPIKSKLRLLKVLIIFRAEVKFYYVRHMTHCWFENLIGLRHLEFRECTLENDALPETIGNLYNLKFLGLTDTFITELPESLKLNENLEILMNPAGSKS